MSQQEKYLAEYEKYKHIPIALGEYYLKDTRISYEVVFIDELNNQAELINLKSKNRVTKTLHWCRKNLVKE